MNIEQLIEHFSQEPALIVIGVASLLSIVLILGLVIQNRHLSKALELLSSKQAESDEGLAGIFDRINQLDSNQSQTFMQLSRLLADDRERQISALKQLSVDLEKRLSESSLSLTQNFHALKTQITEKIERLQRDSAIAASESQHNMSETINRFTEKLTKLINDSQNQNNQHINEGIRKGIHDLRLDLDRNTSKQTTLLNESIHSLNSSTDARLKEISGQVDKRLNEGFEKTTKTFNDVLKRLALIDEAQKKITELSSDVVGLQAILNDKRSRGAFGEVQLQSLVSNLMPDSHYTMQHRFDNDRIADCVLMLPEPTGKIAIDAKFPLESYKKMMDLETAEVDRKSAAKQFARDIKKHITDIACKYILPPETSDGAVMFIPAESVFAEIHGHYPELVQYAYEQKVWMVSPTTLMAILTTATSVIKDEQTRKQIHIIKEHLSALGKDFGSFESRMNNLSKHIGMVTKDVELVHTSARKITSRFDKIERVEVTKEKEDSEVQNTIQPQRQLSDREMVEQD